MGFWDSLRTGFPYSNLHSLNLDWILHEVAELRKEGLTLFDIAQSIANINQKINSLDQEVESVYEVAASANTLGHRNSDAISSLRGSNAETAKNADALDGKPLAAFAAVNLLDNSDFSNPVNQRGLTEYTNNEYSIDRWKIWSPNYLASVTLSAAGVTLNLNGEPRAAFAQFFEKGVLTADTYTLAYCDSNNVVHITTEPIGRADAYDFAQFEVSDNVTVKWACMYEGLYTLETLPPFVPKGYAAELATCYRYYQRYARVRIKAAEGVYPLYYKQTMRAVPTITFKNSSNTNFIETDYSTNSCTIQIRAEYANADTTFTDIVLSADL